MYFSPATHSSPRVWFFTCAFSPLIVRLIKVLLDHGDCIAAGLLPHEAEDDDRSREFRDLIDECMSDEGKTEEWKSRIRGIRCDGRALGHCGAAIAEAIQVFGRIDVLLCCTSEVVVGTVEELTQTHITQSLVREQFETIFFSQVNYIKAVLPHFRERANGHIIILSCTSGHIGTPEISIFCASTRALEGYCDSLGYEIAPFNIKITILQTNKEVIILTNKVKIVPQLSPYKNGHKNITGLRNILVNILNRHPQTTADCSSSQDSAEVVAEFPRLSDKEKDKLVMETVFALVAIGGHENPPARHIVGHEAVASVKERLKIMSEELEDYFKVGCAVDMFKGDISRTVMGGDSADSTSSPRDSDYVN